MQLEWMDRPLCLSVGIALRHGFLHRIDVPCSGLILLAKTYEAFYAPHLGWVDLGIWRLIKLTVCRKEETMDNL